MRIRRWSRRAGVCVAGVVAVVARRRRDRAAATRLQFGVQLGVAAAVLALGLLAPWPWSSPSATAAGGAGAPFEHLISNGGRFTKAELDAAERIAVAGDKTAREIAEQTKIDQLGGIKNLLNKRNPIGPQRFGLMGRNYSRR